MDSMLFRVPAPINEPILGYRAGSTERAELERNLDNQCKKVVEVPCVINGKEIRTGNIFEVRMPHDHQHVIARVHLAGRPEVLAAIEASLGAKKEWENFSWQERTKIFLKAADLLAASDSIDGRRQVLNASTMLGQSKNVYQAEIDSACELIDFLRFNAHFYETILSDQPISAPGILNTVDYRPLEGFVLAITPFNFTAIAGNLPSAPAMVGNTVVWKPSEQQSLSAYYTMKLLMDAGLPAGVINFIPALGSTVGEVALSHPELAGIHFTGSTPTFNHLYKTLGNNLEIYRGFPRLVGETGGKDFVFAHPSADLDVLRVALIRGAFEYQGQKCSAASRAYIPSSIWRKLESGLVDEIQALKVGDVRDFKTIVGAVIDERAFKKISTYLDWAKSASQQKILAGGTADSSRGYFVNPTLIQTGDPKSKTMCEEIFGPILSIFVYDDSKLEETLALCDQTSAYSLTGALISQDRTALIRMSHRLRNAAGNLYWNDKPTGAVVGQQPFGGARKSGTNDKAGSKLNLTRWMSPRTIKENFVPPRGVLYPYMKD